MALDRPSTEHPAPEVAATDSRQAVETVDRGTSEGVPSNGEREAADDITFDELQRLADEEESKFAERKSSEAKSDNRSQPSESIPDPGRTKADDSDDITFEELQALAAEEEANYLALMADRTDNEGSPADTVTRVGNEAHDPASRIRHAATPEKEIPEESRDATGEIRDGREASETATSDDSTSGGTDNDPSSSDPSPDTPLSARASDQSDASPGVQVADQGPSYESDPADNLSPSPLVGTSGDATVPGREDQISSQLTPTTNEETTSSTNDSHQQPEPEPGPTVRPTYEPESRPLAEETSGEDIGDVEVALDRHEPPTSSAHFDSEQANDGRAVSLVDTELHEQYGHADDPRDPEGDAPLRLSTTDSGHKDLLNKPPPDSTVVVDERFTYRTDHQGRVVHASAKLEVVDLDHPRDRSAQAQMIGRLPGDHAGHLFARIFQGPGESINLTAMEGNKVNLGQFKSAENIWRRAIEAGSDVKVEMSLVYATDAPRPDALQLAWWIDGEKDERFIYNTPRPTDRKTQ